MESTNIFIDKFINDKQNNEDPNISLTQNKYVRLSNNIIDINPVPIFIKTTISNATEINTEFNIIAAGMNEQELYVNKNQDPNKESGIFTSQNAYVPMNNILNTDNMYVKLLQQHIFSGIAEMIYTLYNYNGDYKYKINISLTKYTTFLTNN